MDISQIKELIALLQESKLSELALKEGDFELHLKKEPALIQRPKAALSEDMAAFQNDAALHGERGGSTRPQPPVSAPGAFVTSPMVGTFYSSPGPDQAHFVKVGDKVSENSVVCIVEAMKVMNEVKAGVSGTIAEILVDNVQPVEFGTRLFRIV